MSKLRALVILVAGIGALGCASSTRMRPNPQTARPVQDTKPEAPWTAPMAAYQKCVFTRADVLAKQTGSPDEIADAAIAHCASEYGIFRSALSDHFASLVTSDERAEARVRADEQAKWARATTRRGVILIAGGESPRPIDPPRPDERWKTAYGAYQKCLFARADVLAKGSGLASEIADAAIAECTREYLALSSAITDYLVAVVPSQNREEARARAEKQSQEIREDYRRGVISRVLRARGTK